MLPPWPPMATEATEPHSAGEQAGMPWMVCEACSFPLLSEAELIEEKFECWNKVTWAYELSVLGRESAWCYSATNAHDHRFDVVRVLPSALGRSIHCRGVPIPEFSWFPGFSWSMAHCRQCGRHLGWGFSPDEPQPGTGSATTKQGSRKRAAQAEPADLRMEVTVGEAVAADAGAIGAGADARLASAGADAVAVGAEAGVGAVGAGSGVVEEAQRLEHGEDTSPERDTSAEESQEEDEDEDEEELEDEALHLQELGASGPDPGQLSFFGLVLTKMREKDLSRAEVDGRFQALEEARHSQALRRASPRQVVHSLLRMVNRAYFSGQVDDALLAGFGDEIHDPSALAEGAVVAAAGEPTALGGGRPSSVAVVTAVAATDAATAPGVEVGDGTQASGAGSAQLAQDQPPAEQMGDVPDNTGRSCGCSGTSWPSRRTRSSGRSRRATR